MPGGLNPDNYVITNTPYHSSKEPFLPIVTTWHKSNTLFKNKNKNNYQLFNTEGLHNVNKGDTSFDYDDKNEDTSLVGRTQAVFGPLLAHVQKTKRLLVRSIWKLVGY